LTLYEKKQLSLETAESLLQAYYFDAGPTQCQVSKESAMIKIQRNKILEESRFQVQANLTSSVLQRIVRQARGAFC